MTIEYITKINDLIITCSDWRPKKKEVLWVCSTTDQTPLFITDTEAKAREFASAFPTEAEIRKNKGV